MMTHRLCRKIKSIQAGKWLHFIVRSGCLDGPGIPHNFPRIIPTPPDESDVNRQNVFVSRMIPTPPYGSDHPYPSFNPKAPGSRPGRPTSETKGFRADSPFRVLTTVSAIYPTHSVAMEQSRSDLRALAFGSLLSIRLGRKLDSNCITHSPHRPSSNRKVGVKG